jgi:hypothetical protein
VPRRPTGVLSDQSQIYTVSGKWILTRKPLDSADDEAFPRSLDNLLGDGFQGVDFENSFDLRQQTVQEPEVAAGNANDRCGRRGIDGIAAPFDTRRRPPLQQLANGSLFSRCG